MNVTSNYFLRVLDPKIDKTEPVVGEVTIDELIQDGYSGMIAPKGDVNELEAKIEQLVLDKDLRLNIAHNANQIARQYTWDYSAKCIIKAVNKVLKNNEDITSNSRL